jgi:nitrite reductase/ring-hydroxylating ferredoxin subunit
MSRYHVCADTEIAEGGRMVVSCDGTEVGVFRVQGALVAWFNNCPHMRGPVCQGRIFNRVVEPLAEDKTSRFLDFDPETVHVVCPWHGYEFDLRTGQHPGNPKLRLRPVPVVVEEGEVYVEA